MLSLFVGTWEGRKADGTSHSPPVLYSIQNAFKHDLVLLQGAHRSGVFWCPMKEPKTIPSREG